MDTEEGVEVVWNEVKFSERKKFKAKVEKIKLVFDNLTCLKHPNIVKLHRYWMDKDTDKPRIIFITEYMSSGSLKQFLKKSKRNVIKLSLQGWKRWCAQILSALSYLHACIPPIIHGNLSCESIFIQHNGLIKIGSIAPDAIHQNVKTCKEDRVTMHFVAPEYGFSVSPSVDIYSFGVCALEMAALEIAGNGDSGNIVTEEVIRKTLDSLENSLQKDFIQKCLQKDSNLRPTARELLFHPVIFEVHSLKLLSAHAIVKTSCYQPDHLSDEALKKRFYQKEVLAECHGKNVIKIPSDSPKIELEKYLEDVKIGIYPLTAYPLPRPPVADNHQGDLYESHNFTTPVIHEIESRRIINIMCNVKQINEDLNMTLILRLDDNVNRQLSCKVTNSDNAKILSEELVTYGLINADDKAMVTTLIEDTLSRGNIMSQPVS